MIVKVLLRIWTFLEILNLLKRHKESKEDTDPEDEKK